MSAKGFCGIIQSIVARYDARPKDLRTGEHFHVFTSLDSESDGIRIAAERVLGRGADAFYKSDDVVIPMKSLVRADLKGPSAMCDVVMTELDHLMRRLQLGARPPKGWRLFGRRPRVVFA